MSEPRSRAKQKIGENQQGDEDVFVGDDIVFQSLEEIIQGVFNVLDEKDQERLIIPKAINSCVGFIHEVMRIHRFKNDSEENQPGKEGVLTRWEDKDEPERIELDTWTRGSIPVRKKSRSIYAHQNSTSPTHSERIESPKRGGAMTPPKAEKSTKLGSAYFENGETPQVVMIGLDNDDEGRGRLYTGHVKATTKKKEPTATEKAYLRELKEMERMKEEKRRRDEERLLEEEKEKERYEKIVGNLKGKDFVIDSQGNLVVQKKVDANTLPQIGKTVDLTIGDYMKLDSDEPSIYSLPSSTAVSSRRSSIASKRQDDGHSLRNRRGSISRACDGDDASSFFTVSASLQPPLVSTMSVSPGVKLQEGDSVVEGGPIEADPIRISRREYHRRQSLFDSQSIAPLDSPDADGVSSSYLDNISSITDHHPETQSHYGESEESPTNNREERTVIENDPDYAMLLSLDWGRNPALPISYKPRLPRMISSQGRTKIHRLRTNPSFSHRSRKHLPPPLPGQSRGHGLSQLLPIRERLAPDNETTGSLPQLRAPDRNNHYHGTMKERNMSSGRAGHGGSSIASDTVSRSATFHRRRTNVVVHHPTYLRQMA